MSTCNCKVRFSPHECKKLNKLILFLLTCNRFIISICNTYPTCISKTRWITASFHMTLHRYTLIGWHVWIISLHVDAHVYSLFWTCAIFDCFRCGIYLAKNMDFGANTEVSNDPSTATCLIAILVFSISYSTKRHLSAWYHGCRWSRSYHASIMRMISLVISTSGTHVISKVPRHHYATTTWLTIINVYLYVVRLNKSTTMKWIGYKNSTIERNSGWLFPRIGNVSSWCR